MFSEINATRRSLMSRIFTLVLVVIAGVAFATTAAAMNPPAVQTFYVPIPEDQGFDTLNSIYPGPGPCSSGSGGVSSPISTTVSIAIEFAGSYVYYDQWEDGGYDADIANPSNIYSSPGNLSGTQVWGDGDTTNGSAPGYPGDVFSDGDIIVLANDVPTGSLITIDFDGRDKIASTSPVAITRALWGTGTSTLLAGAVEVYDTGDWGTQYESPVGEDTGSQLDMFEYTGVTIMASTDGTTVDIDADANGIAETSIMLDEGESYHVDGGVNEGATVSSTAPVQVDLVTGDICATYESRFFTLLPTNSWSDSAYTPVSTHSGDPTYVFVYNPGPGSITVNWETTSGAQTPLVIAAGTSAQVEMTDTEGARFFSNGAAPFFAVSAIDAEPSSNNHTHDWGFSLIPASSLTQQALVGWGPGKDPTAGGSENSAPVWVMPALLAGGSGSEPFDICVDYDGDGVGGLTDPFGNDYDELLQLDELEPAIVYDTDGDQTGMVLYVCDGSDARIAVVWGQDPNTASGGSPAIDLGTTIPPLQRLAAGKGVALVVDLDTDTEIDQGDTLEYTIVIQNVSRIPVSGASIEDTIPAFTSYVAGSTEIYNGTTTTPVADSGATLFPLDEGGLALPSVPAAGQLEISFRVTVDATADVCGLSSIVNSADVDGSEQMFTVTATSSVHCNPDIHVEKATNGSDADSPTGPAIADGSAVTWTYVVTNPGDVPLDAISVTDDQGVTVTQVDLNTDTFNDGDLDLDGLLDPGESWLYEASGTATLGQYANIGTAQGSPVDEGGSPLDDGDGTPFPSESDDDPSHYLGVPAINLSITKIDLSDPVIAGGAFSYQITVGNAGPSTATGVVVTDTLDPNTTYVSNTGGCSHLAGVLTCALGSIGVGGSVNFTVTVTVGIGAPTAGTKQDDPCDGSEDICNDVSVTANETDSDPSDNTDDEPTNVVECLVNGDCGDLVGCTTDACVANVCVNTPVDANCDNGLFCDGVETCDPVSDCQAGTPVNCTDGIGCTVDSCDEVGDACVNTPTNSLCDDSQFCNGVETCDAVSDCQAGAPIDCNDAVGCTSDACDEVGDACVNTPVDSNCDNGMFCDGVETCDAISDCQAGAPIDCNDSVVCTADSCDEVGDACVNTPTDSLCDDSQFCNGVETCDAISDCQAGAPIDCSDGVVCTADSCDEVGDACVNTPNDSLCDDSQFCNGVETCDAVSDCQAGAPIDCNDAVVCTADSCDEVGDACVNTPNDSLCDDSQFCNGLETCDAISDCQAGAPIDCNDAVACTADSCDEVGDACVNTPNDSLCDDSQFCNGVETCDAISDCQAGTPIDCNDAVVCTADSCDEVGDACVNTATDALCDDATFCNGAETCDPIGDCQAGVAPDCNDGVACTVDMCDEGSAACLNGPNDSLCDNGAFCDGTETCDPLLDCQIGAPVDCDDGYDCSLDSCDEAGDICMNDDTVCFCGDSLPGPGELCDPPASAGGDPACTDDCLFICGNGIVGDMICTAGLIGNGCVNDSDCDVAGGDGVCGVEQCDPPSSEVCNNIMDDDGDGLVDCADPDCSEAVGPTCGETCQFVNECKCVGRDPATIKMKDAPKLDKFKMHARVDVPVSEIDPLTNGFGIHLSNANGVIYQAQMPGNILEVRTFMRWQYKNKLAKKGLDAAGPYKGVFRLGLRYRNIDGIDFLTFRLQVFADLSAATLPDMITQVYGFDDVASLPATWNQKGSGWSLHQKDYEPCVYP